MNTAGDGFVLTFASPSIAIECAEAIADAVRAIDIEVRVGVHDADDFQPHGAHCIHDPLGIPAGIKHIAQPGFAVPQHRAIALQGADGE